MNDTRSPAERLEAQGFVRGKDFDTVGDLIEKDARHPTEGDATGLTASLPFVPACREDYPHDPLPAGIYFGLDESVYHAAPALSSGGIKQMAASQMLYWEECPWLNPYYEEQEQKDHFDLGHAYEVRILEGKEAFDASYAYELDKSDYPGVLVTLKDINKKLEDYGLKGTSSKEAAFEKLVALDPDVRLWDRLVAAHEAEHEGKTMIPAKHGRRIEVAARIVGLDAEQHAATSGGYPQVSLFWVCPKTDVPKKARVDYLKIRSMTDAKTYANQKRRSPESAISQEIANYHYNVQPSHYFEGAQEVRKLIRAHGASVIFSADLSNDDEAADEALHAERVAWAMKWASHMGPDEWTWLFIMTRPTITRLVKWPRGVNKAVTDEICSRATRKFRKMCETYDTDEWLDIEPTINLADEDIPPRALEI